jgi:dipeptidyl aminopeptidase/acylaminoacyl peptidase
MWMRPTRLISRPLIYHGLDDTNVHRQNAVNLIEKLEAIHRPFSFLPLPNTDHAIHGEALATVLMASTLRAGARGK